MYPGLARGKAGFLATAAEGVTLLRQLLSKFDFILCLVSRALVARELLGIGAYPVEVVAVGLVVAFLERVESRARHHVLGHVVART